MSYPPLHALTHPTLDREAITLCCEKAGIFEPARRAPAPIVKRALIGMFTTSVIAAIGCLNCIQTFVVASCVFATGGRLYWVPRLRHLTRACMQMIQR
jgi:hypothetical protein